MADYRRLVNGTLWQTPPCHARRDSDGAVIDDLPAGGAEAHLDGACLGPIDTQPSNDEPFRLDQPRRGNRLQQRRRAEIGWVEQREGPGLPAALAQRRPARRILLDEGGSGLTQGHPMINQASTGQRRRSR